MGAVPPPPPPLHTRDLGILAPIRFFRTRFSLTALYLTHRDDASFVLTERQGERGGGKRGEEERRREGERRKERVTERERVKEKEREREKEREGE